jgi:hypothetical protein
MVTTPTTLSWLLQNYFLFPLSNKKETSIGFSCFMEISSVSGRDFEKVVVSQSRRLFRGGCHLLTKLAVVTHRAAFPGRPALERTCVCLTLCTRDLRRTVSYGYKNPLYSNHPHQDTMSVSHFPS